MRLFVVLSFVVGLAGCSSEVKLKGAPVSVSGKVSQAGQPIGGLVLIFHPLGDGHLREFPLRKDGTFNGELVSGEYTYYVARPTAPGAAQPQAKLSPKYFEPDLNRTIAVDAGKQLAIALD